jgi:hypothetical protein
MVDNELRVATDVKPLDLELGSDVQAIVEGLVFCHIICRTERQSNHVEELIKTMPPPALLRVKESSKYML